MKDIKSSDSINTIYRKGEVKGLKRGILIGSIAAILVGGLANLGFNNITTKRLNSSYIAGYEIPGDHDSRTDNNKRFWYDFNGIANEYDPETMDLDSFLYGAYHRFPQDTRESNLNDLIKNMYLDNNCSYRDFLEYCKAKGLTKVEDGEEIIDIDKYVKETKEYMINYNKKEKIEAKMAKFGGKI